MFFAVLKGCHVMVFFESYNKIGVVAVAYLVGYILDGVIGGFEQLTSLSHTLFIQVFFKGGTE